MRVVIRLTLFKRRTGVNCRWKIKKLMMCERELMKCQAQENKGLK